VARSDEEQMKKSTKEDRKEITQAEQMKGCLALSSHEHGT
jgi:hypothetical protein